MDLSTFPGSWSLVKKNLPTLVGAGLGAVAANFAAGRKAYLQAKKDAAERFPTWSERRMPLKVMRSSRRVGGRRYRARRYYRRPGKTLGDGYAKRIVRTSPVFSVGLAAGTSVYASYSPSLGSGTVGVQTSDLTAAFRVYRIRKVVLHLVPRVDNANSGLANNFQAYVAAACDTEDTTAPTSIPQITAYDNSYQKWITSGDRFIYTFYPKVVNAVGNAGATAYAGSYGMNPWLQLSGSGVNIPHNTLKLGINTASATTLNFDMFLEYHFDVKGIS